MRPNLAAQSMICILISLVRKVVTADRTARCADTLPARRGRMTTRSVAWNWASAPRIRSFSRSCSATVSSLRMISLTVLKSLLIAYATRPPTAPPTNSPMGPPIIPPRKLPDPAMAAPLALLFIVTRIDSRSVSVPTASSSWRVLIGIIERKVLHNGWMDFTLRRASASSIHDHAVARN
uniref:Putative secreted protein n=1 Tax=Anopheles darlingi TaxID=43151 RepID=A0A2M4D714_ANODA